MKIGANEIKPGVVLQLEGKLLVVLKRDTVQPGKGGAFAAVELRDLKTGTKTIERFRTSETVERAHLDETEMQFLFMEGDNATFMDQETYEQHQISKELIGDPADFLKDGMVVTVKLFEGTPLSCDLPQTVTMQLVEADPVVKGQTASSSYKPAFVEGGIRVMVPPHIAVGTKLVINTEDGSYMERAKD
jgi:elongation factor P